MESNFSKLEKILKECEAREKKHLSFLNEYLRQLKKTKQRLITCRACKKNISIGATFPPCPHCGDIEVIAHSVLIDYVKDIRAQKQMKQQQYETSVIRSVECYLCRFKIDIYGKDVIVYQTGDKPHPRHKVCPSCKDPGYVEKWLDECYRMEKTKQNPNFIEEWWDEYCKDIEHKRLECEQLQTSLRTNSQINRMKNGEEIRKERIRNFQCVECGTDFERRTIFRTYQGYDDNDIELYCPRCD
jgi:predicted RNA-binding Zn-ribbon protein involved in translation (DUF1610 family)